MLTGKILKKHFETPEIISLVETTLIAETIAILMRERVDEYIEPIWKNHWHENKQNYLDALQETEMKRDKDWFLDSLTDECLENNWKGHYDKASLLLSDKTYYAKLDQAHIDNDNEPTKEGNCPALEAESDYRTCKRELFSAALNIFSYPVHLHKFPDNASLISFSENLILDFRSSSIIIKNPGVQNPH
mgnify:CR=1 FL=1